MSLITFLFFVSTILDYTKCQITNYDLVFAESNLTSRIFQIYQKTIRPVDNVTVYLGLRYFQLIGIDEKSGIMTSESVINQLWLDPGLADTFF